MNFCNNVIESKPGWGDKKKRKREKGTQKKGGENSPISPPLDPHLLFKAFNQTLTNQQRSLAFLLFFHFCVRLLAWYFDYLSTLCSDSPGLTGLSGNDNLLICMIPSDRPGSLRLESSFSDLFLLIDWRLSTSNSSALNSCTGVCESFHVFWLKRVSKSTFAFSKLSFFCTVSLTLPLEGETTTTSVTPSLSLLLLRDAFFSEQPLDTRESSLLSENLLDLSLDFICGASLGFTSVNSSRTEGEPAEKLASNKPANCDSDSEQWNCLHSGKTWGNCCWSSNSWLFWLEGTTGDRRLRMEYDSSLLPLICESSRDEENSSSGNRPFNGCSTGTHESLWDEGTKLELTNGSPWHEHSCESSSFSVLACPRKKHLQSSFDRPVLITAIPYIQYQVYIDTSSNDRRSGQRKTENRHYMSSVKVVLWRKSHLSYRSHFKTQTRSLYEKKNAVYYFQIFLFVREICKFLKYAN